MKEKLTISSLCREREINSILKVVWLAFFMVAPFFYVSADENRGSSSGELTYGKQLNEDAKQTGKTVSGTVTDEGGNIEVVISRLSGYAKVSIIDNGIGIPAKDLQKVFDRFFQVENHLTRHHEGMGLGLSVAKAMIEAHDGIIWVESIENEGSTFSFLLPLSR